MSYFEDYIEDGLCCEGCGAYLDGSEPGFIRYCAGCEPATDKPVKVSARFGGRGGGKTAAHRFSCQIEGCGERFISKAEKRRHRRNAHGAAQMSARFNLETETGELIPFESAADLFAFVEERMEREAEEDQE